MFIVWKGGSKLSEQGDIGIKGIVIIAVLMALISFGTMYFFMNYFLETPASEDTQVTNRQEIGPTYDLGDFVVNLSGTRGYQIIQADIVVEISNEDTREELDRREPQIRDAVIRILRRQSTEDLEEPGTDQIKEEIINKVNNMLSDGQLTNVWFTRMVIQ